MIAFRQHSKPGPFRDLWDILTNNELVIGRISRSSELYEWDIDYSKATPSVAMYEEIFAKTKELNRKRPK